MGQCTSTTAAGGAVAGSPVPATFDLPSTEGGGAGVNPDDDDRDAQCSIWAPRPQEECPICYKCFPFDAKWGRGTYYMSCCGKSICFGCTHAQRMALKVQNEEKDALGLPWLDLTCPFCRAEWPKNGNLVERYEKRMEMGDATAASNIAGWYREGMYGLPRDAAKSFELYNRAVEMGSDSAAYQFGAAYWNGDGEVARDEAKAKEYMELGAARGSLLARYYLGDMEWHHGNTDVAIKHWRVAAAAGYDDALNELREVSQSKLSEKDLAESVEAHRKATEEMMSENRNQFAAFEAKHGDKFLKYYRPGW